MLIGLGVQEAAWRAALAGQRLHHAWLLVGPKGVGKASFAQWAAATLLGAEAGQGARLLAARSHPDFVLVEREVWDKQNPPRVVPLDQRKDGDSPARSIRIAQIRALEPVLALAPSLSPRRAVVIDAADDLERAAANALLKMLEEPPAGTVFFLISHVPGRLLPTIRSRCRLLRFPPLPDDTVTRVLEQQRPELAAPERQALVAAAHGSPGEALRLADAGVAELDRWLQELAASGDPANATRTALVKALGLKAEQRRYEAFLERAPAFIAERARRLEGERLGTALEHWSNARRLSGAAIAGSLPADAVVFELAGHVAALAGRP